MRSRSSSSSGPGLWRIESGTPTLPMSCIGAACSSVSQSAGGRPIALPRWAQTRLMRVMWRPVSGSRDSATCPSRWTISSWEWRRSWVRSRTRRSSIQLSRITSSFSSISSRASTPSIRRTASGCSASTPSRSSAPISTVSESSTATTVAVRGVRSSTASSPNACAGTEAGEHVALDALGAAHLERARADEVHGVAGRALLEHGLARRVAPPPRALGQRVERLPPAGSRAPRCAAGPPGRPPHEAV